MFKADLTTLVHPLGYKLILVQISIRVPYIDICLGNKRNRKTRQNDENKIKSALDSE